MNQRIIAIAPPKASIAPRKNVDGAALIEQQKTESVNFQREMYSWMLKRKMQGTISVDIQDEETTIAPLSKAGINEAGKQKDALFYCQIKSNKSDS